MAPINSKECVNVPYKNPLVYADVAAALDYNPETGVFTWKINPAKNVKAGTEAGCVKAGRVKNGSPVSYRYIRLNGQEVTAVRLAWLLQTGEWPTARLQFDDGDTLNLRWANIKPTNALGDVFDRNDPTANSAYLKAHRTQFKDVWRNTHFLRKFGITLAEYSEMLLAQNGVCAICQKPETQKRDGKVKALAVDHDHDTGVNRGLLCSDCNTGIGKLKEDRDIFVAAIRYLDKHSGGTPGVVPLTLKGDDA